MKTRWNIFAATALLGLAMATASAAEALAQESGCLDCHALDRNGIGPAFRVVAGRYREIPAARAALIETVKHGGKENWIEVSHGAPMPPYSPRLSDEQIQQLVDWILSL